MGLLLLWGGSGSGSGDSTQARKRIYSYNPFLDELDIGRLTQAIRQVTEDYTVTKKDDLLVVDASDGDKTITMMDAANVRGYMFNVKKTDSSSNTVTISSADNIDGASTAVITTQYESITITSDGTEWWIV